MAEKRVSVRLVAEGGRQVRAELEGIGDAGARGFGRLSSEMELANARLGSFARKAGIALAAVTVAAAAAGVAMIRSGLANVDAQAKLAQSMRTTVESVQTLTWAGELAGVSMGEIEQATKNKVAMGVAIREVAGNLPLESRLADRQVTELNAQAAAGVDLRQREDVQLAIDGQRAMLDELSELTKPEFRERLEWLGKVMDESGPTPSGGWKTDKLNELYQYVISLGGRIKMAKELAGAHGVYLPLQRKMFKLDEGKSAAPFEDLLARLGSAQQGNA